MTSPQTLPIVTRTAPPHEHAWLVDSRHSTSEGIVLYVRCVECPARRVDLQRSPQVPPVALSRTTVRR